MTFRGRLTLFLSALVLAPLLAGGVAAHVLADRQGVRDADARLQSSQARVQQVKQDALDAATAALTPGVVRRAVTASAAELDGLRRARGLGFLLVLRHDRVVTSAMGDPLFSAPVDLRPTRLSDLDGFAPYLVRLVRVGGGPDAVVGGGYLDGRFLRSLDVPAMTVVGGRVVASTVPDAPRTLAPRQSSTLPDGRRVLFLYTLAQVAGIAIVAPVEHPGFMPGSSGWVLGLIALGIVVGTGLAFELARVLSRPHERALGKLEESERLSFTDSLTGVPNRRRLESVLAEEAKRAGRFGRPFSVLMVDVDHFKRINDTYGHAIGDEALVEVARRIKSALRSDLDTVARYGGEEFTVVLPETPREGAVVVAEKIRRTIADSPLREGLEATVSVGVASRPDDGVEPGSLLQAADRALYEAKRGGRDRVVAGR